MANWPCRLSTLSQTAHLGSGAILRANLKPLRSQPVRKNASLKTGHNPRRVAIHGDQAVQVITPVDVHTFGNRTLHHAIPLSAQMIAIFIFLTHVIAILC